MLLSVTICYRCPVTVGTRLVLSGPYTPNVEIPSKHGNLTDLNLEVFFSFSSSDKFKRNVIRHFKIMSNENIKMSILTLKTEPKFQCKNRRNKTNFLHIYLSMFYITCVGFI
jgi:hypothetical protein